MAILLDGLHALPAPLQLGEPELGPHAGWDIVKHGPSALKIDETVQGMNLSRLRFHTQNVVECLCAQSLDKGEGHAQC